MPTVSRVAFCAEAARICARLAAFYTKAASPPKVQRAPAAGGVRLIERRRFYQAQEGKAEMQEDRAVVVQARNRFDRMEIAGAFGDLGTLVPLVVAYIGVLKMDAFGVLLAFG
jgi:hypothetical protein